MTGAFAIGVLSTDAERDGTAAMPNHYPRICNQQGVKISRSHGQPVRADSIREGKLISTLRLELCQPMTPALPGGKTATSAYRRFVGNSLASLLPTSIYVCVVSRPKHKDAQGCVENLVLRWRWRW
jgi:hypothetical protein